jgi:hypothetical protein
MVLRSPADVAFRRVWLSMKSAAVSVFGHSFNFSFPAHNHWTPVSVIMIVVRLYQRDKYCQSAKLYLFESRSPD